MFLVNICIASGIVYAGFKSFIKGRRRKNKTWIVQVNGSELKGPSLALGESSTEPSEAATSHYLAATSVSLGLSVSGLLLYAPLSLVSVPLTVYGAIPFFERDYVTLFKKRQLKMALLQSVAVIATLATQHYVVASLITWLYHYIVLHALRWRRVSDFVWSELEGDYRQFISQFYGTKPRSVWVMVHGVEIELPFEELRVDDIVIVNKGEVIPVEGRVVEGTAQVSPVMAIGPARRFTKGVGDHVVPFTMVLAGKLCVRVDRL